MCTWLQTLLHRVEAERVCAILTCNHPPKKNIDVVLKAEITANVLNKSFPDPSVFLARLVGRCRDPHMKPGAGPSSSGALRTRKALARGF